LVVFGLSPTRILANPLLRLFAGATLISFSPVWVKLASVSPTTSGFYRLAIGGAALAVILAVSGRRLQLSKRAWQFLLAATIFFALDVWFFHRSIMYVGPGLATLLSNFQVFFMMLAGVLLLGQRPHLPQLIAVPLALFGLGLIVGFDWSDLPGDYRWGVIFGLLTALVYAGYMLTMRAARRDSNDPLPVREVAVISIGSAIMLGIAAFAEGESLAIPTLIDAVWLFNYGFLSQCLGLLLIASSLLKVTTTQAGIALLLQPTLSFTWDVLFFDRPMTAVELGGAMLALAAIYLGSRNSSKQI
jgi:drug/metabolite transporter (DMT)-like permease